MLAKEMRHHGEDSHCGWGFGAVMAPESLSKQVSEEHQITLISRKRKFLFY
jgi:hypothetical protein